MSSTESEKVQGTPPAEFVKSGAPLVAEESVPLCPVCGGAEHGRFAEGYDYELMTCANRWRFVHCDECGHVWLNPRPAISELGTIYPKHYYAYNYASKISPIAVKAKEWLDRGKMKGIVSTLGRAPGSYMDIGCGDGRFLRSMEKLGVPREKNYGLELDERVVAPLREQGFQAFCERVEDCERVPEGALDLITMFHVIEHVDDPASVVRQAAKWLAPGGIFAVETPNLDSLDARVFHETYWGGYHIPRHWNLFKPDTLARLFADQGLEPVATRYQTGHSFWMYSMHHWLRYEGTPRPRLARCFDPVGGFLPFLAGFTAFDKARGALGAKTSAILM
ncbi:MAG: class I SAM-dependent methyltransferase, partial [Verrucomicrobiae bacterium]|nr:class I SAM-dependent methyltransferase [Verrucomicrobiae bacterium]